MESIGGFHVVLLVPECLAGLQCVLNSFLRFLLATQRFESFPLQVEDVLLAHGRAWCYISAAQYFRDLVADLHFLRATAARRVLELTGVRERRHHVHSAIDDQRRRLMTAGQAGGECPGEF